MHTGVSMVPLFARISWVSLGRKAAVVPEALCSAIRLGQTCAFCTLSSSPAMNFCEGGAQESASFQRQRLILLPVGDEK